MTILESAIWYVNGDSVQTGTLKYCGDCDEIRVALCCVCGFTPFGGNWPDITMIGTTWRYVF